MARDLELWGTIRADFLATGQSYSSLAKKYGVSLSAVKRAAAKEGWRQERNSVDLAVQKSEPKRRKKRTEPKPTEPEETGAALDTIPTDAEIIEGKQDRFAKFMEITDAMMDRISDALASPEVISPYSLKLLASALRDIREMQGLNRTELDIEEQQARIAKLRSDTRIIEAPESHGVIVEFVDTYGAEE